MWSTFDLRFKVSLILNQIEWGSAQKLVDFAQDQAAKANTRQKVIDIFQAFANTLSSFDGKYLQIQRQLNETLTLTEISLSPPSEELARKIAVLEEIIGRMRISDPLNVEPASQQMVRTQDLLAQEAIATTGSSLYILEFPQVALESIFDLLPKESKSALYLAAASHTAAKVRAAALVHVASFLLPIFSDRMFQGLYQLVFGESISVARGLQSMRWLVSKEDTKTIHQLDGSLVQLYRSLQRIRREWDALPPFVKKLFGNLASPPTFDNAKDCNGALSAIRAYNLICVAKKIPELNAILLRYNLETVKGGLLAGERISKFLRDNEYCFRHLNLSIAGITCLPLEIVRLRYLESLNLAANSLSYLPPEIGSLSALMNCILSKNQLTTLPSQIGNLQNLGNLEVAFNQLTTVPPEIANCPKLARFDISRNPLTSIPIQFSRARIAIIS